MRYQKFSPAPVLEPFVECYFTWRGFAEDEVEVQSPPSGLAAIVVNYSAPYSSYQNSSSRASVPQIFACGLFTSNYHLVLKGTIGMAGIVFKPSALHNIYGVRMSHLVNSRMPLELLIGNQAKDLFDQVSNQDSDKSRVKVLEDFALPHVRTAKSNLSVIDETIDYIDACKGCISVDKVAERFKISRSYLEKRFLEKVGISPKLYARIKRFGALSYFIANNDKIDWQEIVFTYGFHDQSHLIKEFLEFNQMNPSQYHLFHREMTRFVSR